MEKTHTTIRAVAAAALMIAAGCGGDDGRLAEYAKNSVEQQTRQNEQIARQNLEVTRQNQQVAEAARNLVEADAKARQEMVAAQKSLQDGLQAERSTLDQQRQELELERKDIARERYREPVIAQAIAGCGVLLACLLPLAICIYVLRHIYHDRGDETVLNELLVEELTADRPRLLLPLAENVPALEQELPPDDTDAGDHITSAPTSAT